MYFCYVDESGDCGTFDSSNPDQTGSPYFILVGLIVDSSKWKVGLDVLKAYRKKIAREAYLAYDVEFHCADMIDPHKIKAYSSISVPDRWKVIKEYAGIIGSHKPFSIIAVVLDKRKSLLTAADYLTTAITKLYQVFDEFLKPENKHGIVLFDRANEKYVTTHVRRLLGTGASGISVPGIKIARIIEDPVFRISTDSMFIQSADVIAYTLQPTQYRRR